MPYTDEFKRLWSEAIEVFYAQDNWDQDSMLMGCDGDVFFLVSTYDTDEWLVSGETEIECLEAFIREYSEADHA